MILNLVDTVLKTISKILGPFEMFVSFINLFGRSVLSQKFFLKRSLLLKLNILFWGGS